MAMGSQYFWRCCRAADTYSVPSNWVNYSSCLLLQNVTSCLILEEPDYQHVGHRISLQSVAKAVNHYAGGGEQLTHASISGNTRHTSIMGGYPLIFH